MKRKMNSWYMPTRRQKDDFCDYCKENGITPYPSACGDGFVIDAEVTETEADDLDLIFCE